MLSQTALVTTAALTATFTLLFCLERLAPLRQRRAQLVQRLLVNLCVSALAILTAYLVVAPAARAALEQVSVSHVGLLQWIELPPVLDFVAGFLLLDLLFYYWHLANHKIRLLWRFHNVHHIDPDLDVSTAFRFHFGEVGLSAAFRVLQVVLVGVSPLAFAAYELVFEMNTLFHHSNVRLPLAVERLLNKILVTPRMHGVHHSDVLRENNSNYSVVFSCWDRIHRTLRLNIDQSRIVIGVPAYLEPRNNRVGALIALPFRGQPDYWRTKDGTLIERDERELPLPLRVMGA